MVPMVLRYSKFLENRSFYCRHLVKVSKIALFISVSEGTGKNLRKFSENLQSGLQNLGNCCG